MALLEKQLVVKKSTIPGSGNGLFTKVFIPKGTRIVEYKGRITSWKDADHDDGHNLYLFYIKRYHVIDARPYKKALARFSNDANGFTKVPGLKNNSTYVTDGLKAFLESTKDIQAGEEIFVDYGKKYWVELKKIMKKKEKEEKEKAIKKKVVKKKTVSKR
jgi:SET domain-containing protein